MIRRWSPAVVSILVLSALVAGAKAQEAPKHDAVKPVPRDGGWMKRHEAINARVAQGNVDVVFIGDSITQGWEGAGRKVWEEFYGKRNAANLGIGGDRTQHVLWRLDNGNMKGISPKLAVVMIGTNNSGQNTPREIADGVTAIVRSIQAKSPQTEILLLAVFPRGASDNDARREVNTKANNLFAKLDADKNVHYVDIGPNFLSDKGELTREIMPDLLHLSDKGYRIWAESIEPHVKELLGEK